MTISVRRAIPLVVALALAASAQVACRGGEPSAAPRPGVSTTSAPPTPLTSPTPPGSTPTPRTTPSRTTAAPPYPARLAGQDIERIPTDRRVVALTFDAGANADGIPPILATLAREQITSTFFLTADFVAQFPEPSRSIVRAGHRLGNHSATHPSFPTLTDAQMRAQLTGTEDKVRATTGATTKPLFRFPFGDRAPHTIAVVNAEGYVAVRWTVDSLGWQGTSGGRSAQSVTDRVLAAAQPGEIALMHVGAHPTDHSTLDADALPGIIAGLRQRGYAFVTLDALIG